VQFDIALNLVWLLLGITALSFAVRAALNARPANRSSAWLHIVGVALVVAALFPYISATDDLVRSQNLSTRQDRDHGRSGTKAPNDNLIRLYETLDSPLACVTCTLTFTFFAVWIVFAPAVKRSWRVAPSSTGRSPPGLLAL
jgi:hypothetical protein